MKRLMLTPLAAVALLVAGQASASTYSYTLQPIASAQEQCGATPAGCSLPGSYLQLQDATNGTYSRVPVSGTITFDTVTGAIGGSIVLNFQVVAGGGLLTVTVNTTAFLGSNVSGVIGGGLTGTGAFPGTITVTGGTYDAVGFVNCAEAIAGLCAGLAGFPAGTTVTDESDVPFNRTTPPNLWGGGTLTFGLTTTDLDSNFFLQGNTTRVVHLSGNGGIVAPEPGTLLLIVSGLSGLAFFGRRRS